MVSRGTLRPQQETFDDTSAWIGSLCQASTVNTTRARRLPTAPGCPAGQPAPNPKTTSQTPWLHLLAPWLHLLHIFSAGQAAPSRTQLASVEFECGQNPPTQRGVQTGTGGGGEGSGFRNPLVAAEARVVYFALGCSGGQEESVVHYFPNQVGFGCQRGPTGPAHSHLDTPPRWSGVRSPSPLPLLPHKSNTRIALQRTAVKVATREWELRKGTMQLFATCHDWHC